MKWFKARTDHICSACNREIKEGEMYYAGTSQSFCAECGKLYSNGKLRFSKKDKGYIDIATKDKCDFCSNDAVWSGKGVTICEEHLGGYVSDV